MTEATKRPHLVDGSTAVAEEEEDESNLCVICFSVWTSQGQHQLCSLKCGHFFGYSCIMRTFQLQQRNSQHCPVCNQRAKESDIRVHYAQSKFSTRDSAKEEQLKEQLLQERAARVQAEQLVAKANIQILALQNELKTFRSRSEPQAPNNAIVSLSPARVQNSSDSEGLEIIKNFIVPMHQQSTVLAWVSPDKGVAVSTIVNGRHKILLANRYLPAPSQPHGGTGFDAPICDISVHRGNQICYGGALAVGARDGKIALVSVSNLNEVSKIDVAEPIMCLCFVSEVCLAIGTTKKKLLVVDPRIPNAPASCIATFSEPVHSIVNLANGYLCVATFSNIHVVHIESRVILPVKGFRDRVEGERYISLVGVSCGVLTVGLSVRCSNGDSYIEVGCLTINLEICEFLSVQSYSGRHSKPKGRLSLSGRNRAIVIDEQSRKCVLYPDGPFLNIDAQPLAVAFGDDPRSLVVATQDQIFFVLVPPLNNG